MKPLEVGDVLVYPLGTVHHYEVLKIEDEKVLLKLIYEEDVPFPHYQDWSDISWVERGFKAGDWHYLTPLEKAML